MIPTRDVEDELYNRIQTKLRSYKSEDPEWTLEETALREVAQELILKNRTLRKELENQIAANVATKKVLERFKKRSGL